MTEDEANAEAVKRERHKSKHLTHKRWLAVHDSVKGWHVALVDNHVATPVKPAIFPDRVAIAIAMFGVDATLKALAMIAEKRRP